jgi:hypothetical protein
MFKNLILFHSINRFPNFTPVFTAALLSTLLLFLTFIFGLILRYESKFERHRSYNKVSCLCAKAFC